MPSPYLLPSPHGHHYYETAQLAAFAVYVALLLGQGYRRGYPQRAWLPLVAAATLALVLGCQLVLLPPGQWLAWLGGDAGAVQALAGGPRSVVGGALASFVVVAGLRRALGFRSWGVFDAFAGPLCWAMAVQSIGCVLAGCCWGEPTAGPWGVAYGPGTPAYAAQLAQGLIGEGAAHSLPLVPTQLLHLLLCAGAGLVLHATRRRAAGWPGGSCYLLAMGLLCLGRFAIEGYRDLDGEPLLAQIVTLGGVSWPGLRWFMLLEAVGQLGLWAWLVRRAPAPGPVAAPAPPAAAPVLVGLGLLLATTWLAPAVLSLPEIAVLQALLLLVLLAEGHTLLVTLGRGVPRLAGLPLAVLLGGALLLATAQAPAPQKRTPAEGRQLTLSGGYLANNYNERPENACSRSQYVYGHRSQAGGGEVAYKWRSDSSRALLNAVGGGVWVGSQQISVMETDNSTSQPPITSYQLPYQLYDIHLYTERNAILEQGQRLSYRLGLHLGQLGPVVNNGSLYNPYVFSSLTNTSDTHILPELMLAYGGHRVFGQLDLGYGAENALGGYAGRLGAGARFGRSYGTTLLAGLAASNSYEAPTMAFASVRLRLPLHNSSALLLEPYAATGFNSHYQLSVKLHYQLGLK